MIPSLLADHPSRQLCSVSVLIADDHRLVLEGLRELLSDHFRSLTIVDSGEQLVAIALQDKPDLVITDLSMPGRNGIEAMREVHERHPDIPFIVLTMHQDPGMVAHAMRSGARAYVLKSCARDELIRAAECVMGGQTYVTSSVGREAIAALSENAHVISDKQRLLLRYLATGLRSKQIALALGVSVRTIESQKYAIMKELDAHSTLELIRKAQRYGLV